MDTGSTRRTLPDGAVLVHIGPHKTGTTAVQRVMNAQRKAMAELGVLYPGTDYRHRRPVHALLGKSPTGWPAAARAEWQELVDEVRRTDARLTCISAEELAAAEVEQIRTLVEDLGGDRVHIAIGVRRLDALLRSEWQQRVKSAHGTRTYDDWLRDILAPEHSTIAARLWHEHDLAQVLERWLQVVPPERVILLVGSESDRTRQPHAFEELLGLPEDLLIEERTRNPSLSYERIELMRQVNEVCNELELSDPQRYRYVRSGFCHGLAVHAREEQETSLPKAPDWARDRFAELGELRSRTVAESGAVVFGDPDELRPADTRAPGEDLHAPHSVPIGAVTAGMTKLLTALSAREDELEQARANDLTRRSSKDLLAEIVRRRLGRRRGNAG